MFNKNKTKIQISLTALTGMLVFVLKRFNIKSALLLSIFASGLTKIAGLYLTLFIAKNHGASTDSDRYFYLTNCYVLVTTFLRAVNHSVFAPLLVSEKSRSIRLVAGLLNSILYSNVIIVLTLIGVGLLYNQLTNSKLNNLIGLPIAFGLENTGHLLNVFIIYSTVSVVFFFLSDTVFALGMFYVSIVVGFISGLTPAVLVTIYKGQDWVCHIFLGSTIVTVFLIFVILIHLWKQFGWRPWVVTRFDICQAGKSAGWVYSGNLVALLSNYLTLHHLSIAGTGFISLANYSRALASAPRTLLLDQVSMFFGVRANSSMANGETLQLTHLFTKVITGFSLVFWPFCIIIVFYYSKIAGWFIDGGKLSVWKSREFSILFIVQILALNFVFIDSIVSKMFIASSRLSVGFLSQIVFYGITVLMQFWGVKYYGLIGYGASLVIPYAILVIGVFSVVVPSVAPFIKYRRDLFQMINIGFYYLFPLLLLMWISHCTNMTVYVELLFSVCLLLLVFAFLISQKRIQESLGVKVRGS